MLTTALNSFTFDNPTKLLFGTGKLGELHNEKMPGKKALLLTSAGKSTKTNGSLDKTIDELKKVGVEYVHLANVVENPLKQNCEDAGKFARENGCDFIVALGGGAVLDSSVAVAIMATNAGDLWDYVFGGTGKGKIATNQPLPIITIATSSGTGSEMNEWGVICKEDTNEKIGISLFAQSSQTIPPAETENCLNPPSGFCFPQLTQQSSSGLTPRSLSDLTMNAKRRVSALFEDFSTDSRNSIERS